MDRSVARLFEFSAGGRGAYSGGLSFGRPGDWAPVIAMLRRDGGARTALILVPVAERTRAPAVGDPVPASATSTTADVDSLADLTIGGDLDPALYRFSIAGAVAVGRPFFVAFASPAFCTSELCGPHV